MRNVSIGARRTPSIVAAVIVLAAVFAGCSGAASAPQDESVQRGAAGGAGAPSAAAAAGEQLFGEAKGQDGQPLTPGTGPAAFRDGAKIIRTGSLQLEVGDVRASLTAARTAIQNMGGYIGGSQQYRDGDNDVATIAYRIPTDRWEEALDALRALGEPVGEQTDAADVTSQIVDLDARIRNLKASETALVRHLTDAARVADVLEIEARLSDVRGQIEQLSAQKANLDDQVAYATLTVTFGVEVQAVREAAERWDPRTQVDQAGASLVGFLQLVASAGIWLAIVGLPIVFILAIIVAIGVFVARRLGFLRRAAGPPPPASAQG